MNILQVGSYLPPDLVGGAEYTAKCFAEIFEKANHRVVNLRWAMEGAVSLKGTVALSPKDDWELRTWRPMPPLGSGSLPRKAIFYAMEWLAQVSIEGLVQMLDSEEIHLVVVHSFRGMGYDVLSKIASCKRPMIVVLHDFALVCLNKGMARHGTLCNKLCSTCVKVASRNNDALRSATRVALLSPSAFLLSQVRRGLALDAATYSHIPNPNRYDFLPRVRTGSKVFTWGYFGRIEPDKGFVPELFDMAERLHRECGARWIVAGKGANQDALVLFAKTRPWVEFRGLLAEAEMCRAFDAIDVLAVPSLWPENFPGILVQALGNGVPAVGFDIGGIAEIIDHGETGLVAPFRDFGALGDALLSLAHNRARLSEMSTAALKAAERYAPDALGQRLLQLVAEVAGSARSLESLGMH